MKLKTFRAESIPMDTKSFPRVSRLKLIFQREIWYSPSISTSENLLVPSLQKGILFSPDRSSQKPTGTYRLI